MWYSTNRYVIIYNHFLRLKWICGIIDNYTKEHEIFTNQVLKQQEDHGKSALSKETIDNHVRIFNKRANDNFKAIQHRDEILDEAKTIAQYETFLETAPQAILQLYIVFQLSSSEEMTWIQWVSIIKTFMFFEQMWLQMGSRSMNMPILEK